MHSQEPSFCINTALERVGGDHALFREISILFHQEYPALQNDMEIAIQSGDAHQLMVAAHTLKGSLATFGADAAQKTALRLEMMGRHANLSGAEEAFIELKQLLQKLDDDLASAKLPA